MAIAFDGTANSVSFASSTLTYSHTVTDNTNGVLVVCPAWFALSGAVTGVTYNGVALTQVSGAAVHRGFYFVDMWYLKAPATGANNVVITMDGTVIALQGGSTSWTGVDQTTTVGTAANNNNSGTSATVATACDAGDVTVGIVIWNASNVANVSSSDTERFERTDTGTGDNNVINGSSSTTEDVTLTWANTASRDWAACGVALKVASAASITGPLVGFGHLGGGGPLTGGRLVRDRLRGIAANDSRIVQPTLRESIYYRRAA